MATTPLDGLILELKRLRIDAADVSRRLAERELAGRELRLVIETEHRAQGVVKTEAEKLAKADHRYLAHERASIQHGYDRDVLLAEAEALWLNILLQLAVLERTRDVLAAEMTP